MASNFSTSFLFRLFPSFLLLCFISCVFVSAEKKVSVSEVVFDSPVEDIQWLGKNHKTVLSRTIGGRIYRSLDSGRNWSEITDLLRRVAGGSSNDVAVDNIVVNPVDKDIVLVVGKKRNHFISGDGARSFRIIEHSGSIHNFLFHPTRSQWALMSRWTDACDPPIGTKPKGACRHDLYFTNDLGKTFLLLVNYVVQYNWGEAKMGQADAVFFSHFVKGRQASQPRNGGWSENVHFSTMASPSSTVHRLVSQGNKFLISNGYLFVAKLLDADKQSVSLMVSTDGGANFAAAKLPVELQERSYTILDSSENSVMLHVNHGHGIDADVMVGNVYISDAAGLRYSLSLPRNVRTSSGECEFDRVASLEGVYIANFRDDKAKQAAQQVDDDTVEAMEEDELDALETAVEKRKRLSRKGKSEAVVKTVISFDKGGVWSYLKPPKVDSRGKKIDCSTSYSRPSNTTSNFTDLSAGSATPGCWLHLHGITNFHRFAPFYSVSNAVGIIMGTGNVGESLRYEEDEVNTYLSRDGGLNWVEAHKGGYIYEFGDHGGLIVMANDMAKTNQVVFSWNEGQSWYDFDLGDQSLNVDNVVIEPNSSSVEFLLYGTRGGSGVLYHLDFATLGQPACKGVWAADSVSSDYETWTATDGRTGDACILGRQLTFTRRKQTSECFNGQDFDRPVEKKNCTCTERDFECEYGFTRSIEGLECKPEDPTLTQEGCISSGIFYADAYRRIPGDTCFGGWSPPKVPVKCPATSPFSSRAKFVLFSVFGLLGAVGLLTFLSNDPRFKGLLSNAGFDSLSDAKYAVIGGAARFVDAFESSVDGTGFGQHPDSIHHLDGDLGFIEAEQQNVDDLDAPPLLDFSANAPNEVRAHESSFRRPPTDVVPRLVPPPSSGAQPIQEFEML